MADAQPEQAPAPRLRDVRGQVLFRLADVEVKGVKRPGQVLPRTFGENGKPPYGAVAWFDGRAWREDFGGTWKDAGDGRLEWKWA